MSHPLRRSKSLRAASALMSGIVSIAFVAGCDSAPATGSVEMGGKEGRAKIQPGAPPAPAVGAAPAKTTKKGPPMRSIKERPGQ